MPDRIFAGFNTSSTSLVYVGQEDSRSENARWQQRLRTELSAPPRNTKLQDIDGLAVLQGVSTETLRLCPPATDKLVKVSPRTPTLLRLENEITVTLTHNAQTHVQVYELHRHYSAFDGPKLWEPQRCLEKKVEQLKEMNRWF